jgi:hypothetical protein
MMPATILLSLLALGAQSLDTMSTVALRHLVNAISGYVPSVDATPSGLLVAAVSFVGCAAVRQGSVPSSCVSTSASANDCSPTSNAASLPTRCGMLHGILNTGFPGRLRSKSEMPDKVLLASSTPSLTTECGFLRWSFRPRSCFPGASPRST